MNKKSDHSKKELRWVYGDRYNKWYLVDDTDRDFVCGITQDRFKQIGKKAARAEYLAPYFF